MKTQCQIMCNAAKAVLWGEFMVLSAYCGREDLKINNLSFPVKKVEKEEQFKPKAKENKL